MNNDQFSIPTNNILIVDDTLPNLRLLSKMLRKQGYKVRGAPNGTMALSAAQLAPPDLILLDIHMPDINGYEVCQRLKANEETRDIPIIFISALSEVLDKVKAFSVGGVDYITKPFQVEEVLVRVKTHLAMRDLQKKLQETNNTLMEANSSLTASNEELDAFAYTVAHDLKNPLATIVSVSDYLLEEYAEEKSSDKRLWLFMESIKDTGMEGIGIIDELLLLATVRKGDVELGAVDMEKAITNVQRRLGHILEKYKAEYILPDKWPTALGYGPWLEEVWINYITNALKYGGQPPHFELGATPQADGSIRFWIDDNGEGLSAEAQKAIFTEFTRLSQLRAEGHGLGLPIVKRIIEKLEGTVGVESEVGKGCLFYFELPQAKRGAN
jgi:signal transduction histidine kinase